MEFWGIEVKPGQTVKCDAGDENILHLSQASLGESKKEKRTENVPIFVKINNKKLVIGTLATDRCAQIQYDLVFEKEFELSHGSKNTSVFFVGYKRVYESDESEDDLHDSSSEDDLEIDGKANGKPSSENEQGKSTAMKATAGKDDNVAAKVKSKPKKELVKADDKTEDKDVEDDSDDEDDSEDDSDEDKDSVEASGDSSEEDEDDSSEKEDSPVKVETGKKRNADSASKTPIPEKRAKVVTPAGNQKTGGDGKKGHVHVATPYPAKKGKKPQQFSKSGGSTTCKSCFKTFNNETALQIHTKTRHGAAAK